MGTRHIDQHIDGLKEKLLSMGGYVEKAIEFATQALLEGDISKVESVQELEAKINQAHIAVDEVCLRLLALRQPMACDLRLVVAILKINTDLERMGDQAVNIALNGARYLKSAPVSCLIDLPKMSQQVRIMVKECLDAFVQGSRDLARAVLQRDDQVDSFKNQIFRDVLDYIQEHPREIEQGLSLILIARNLERIGDHATNIAEDVIFAATGEDIRHAARPHPHPTA